MGTSADPTDAPPRPIDFLVGSPPGQFLWFKVIMKGDGIVTPALASARLRLPRQSYVEYLPAVFLEDEAGRRFLERFLAVFQATWDGLEAEIDRFPSLADPSAVKPTHLNVLASWLGQTSRTAGPPSSAASSSRHCLGSSSPHANPARTGREARVAGPWAASAITSPQCSRPCRAGSNSKASPS